MASVAENNNKGGRRKGGKREQGKRKGDGSVVENPERSPQKRTCCLISASSSNSEKLVVKALECISDGDADGLRGVLSTTGASAVATSFLFVAGFRARLCGSNMRGKSLCKCLNVLLASSPKADATAFIVAVTEWTAGKSDAAACGALSILLGAGASPHGWRDVDKAVAAMVANKRTAEAHETLYMILDDPEMTPLGIVAKRGSAAAAKLLLGAGAGIPPLVYRRVLQGCQDPDGGVEGPSGACHLSTPLHLAAQHNNPNVVAVLLEYGADPNLGGGCTYRGSALCSAAARVCTEAADFNATEAILCALVVAKGDPGQKTFHGHTPSTIALQHGNRSVELCLYRMLERAAHASTEPSTSEIPRDIL